MRTTGNPRGSATPSPPKPRFTYCPHMDTTGISSLACGSLGPCCLWKNGHRGGLSQACVWTFFKEHGGQLLRPNGWEGGALALPELSSSYRLK